MIGMLSTEIRSQTMQRCAPPAHSLDTSSPEVNQRPKGVPVRGRQGLQIILEGGGEWQP
jgi:hypothetical protein